MLTEEEMEQAKQEEKTAYNKGLTDAWEAAKKITTYEKAGGLSVETIEEIFGTPFCEKVFRELDAAEAIAKIKAYEKEQDEIKVGDEIVYKCNNREKTGVVYEVANSLEGNAYRIFSPFEVYDIDTINRVAAKIKKTGRHFPQIEELLKAMKEGR